MSMLDGLFGFQKLFINGVQVVNRASLDLLGCVTSRDDGTTMHVLLGGLTFTAVKNTSYAPAYGEHVRAGAAITVTLPLASAQAHGRVGVLLTATAAVTIARSGADTINGATSLGLTTAYDSVILQSDGVSSWYIVGRVNAGV